MSEDGHEVGTNDVAEMLTCAEVQPYLVAEIRTLKALLREAAEALAAEFGHAEMMQEEKPDRIDLVYRTIAHFGRDAR